MILKLFFFLVDNLIFGWLLTVSSIQFGSFIPWREQLNHKNKRGEKKDHDEWS